MTNLLAEVLANEKHALWLERVLEGGAWEEFAAVQNKSGPGWHDSKTGHPVPAPGGDVARLAKVEKPMTKAEAKRAAEKKTEKERAQRIKDLLAGTDTAISSGGKDSPILEPSRATAPVTKVLKKGPSIKTYANDTHVAHYAQTLEENASLTKEAKEQYRVSLSSCVSAMPPKAAARLREGLEKIHFSEDTRSFYEPYINLNFPTLLEFAKKSPDSRLQTVAAQVGNAPSFEEKKAFLFAVSSEFSDAAAAISVGVIGGAYFRGSRQAMLDGGLTMEDRLLAGRDRDTTAEIHAHELTHAIDGPHFELSKSLEWKQAWSEEIDKTIGPDSSGEYKLSSYAATDTQEGFAEFGRLLYGSNVDRAEIEKHFPKSMAFFRTQGLIE